MPTNLEIAASKLLHPSNSKKFFTPEEFAAVESQKALPFPMVEFLAEELPMHIEPEHIEEAPVGEYADDDSINFLHSHILHMIKREGNVDGGYRGKYKYLSDLFYNRSITVDEFMYYGRILSKHEAAIQLKEEEDPRKPHTKAAEICAGNWPLDEKTAYLQRVRKNNEISHDEYTALRHQLWVSFVKDGPDESANTGMCDIAQAGSAKTASILSETPSESRITDPNTSSLDRAPHASIKGVIDRIKGSKLWSNWGSN